METPSAQPPTSAPKLATAIRIEVLKLGEHQGDTSPRSTIFVETDRISYDRFGNRVCFLSDIIPKAAAFSSPLKSSRLRIYRFDQGFTPVVLGRGNILANPECNATTIGRTRVLDAYRLQPNPRRPAVAHPIVTLLVESCSSEFQDAHGPVFFDVGSLRGSLDPTSVTRRSTTAVVPIAHGPPSSVSTASSSSEDASAASTSPEPPSTRPPILPPRPTPSDHAPDDIPEISPSVSHYNPVPPNPDRSGPTHQSLPPPEDDPPPQSPRQTDLVRKPSLPPPSGLPAARRRINWLRRRFSIPLPSPPFRSASTTARQKLNFGRLVCNVRDEAQSWGMKVPEDGPEDIRGTDLTVEELYTALDISKWKWHDTIKRWDIEDAEKGLHGAPTVIAWSLDPDARHPERADRLVYAHLNSALASDLKAIIKRDREGLYSPA